VMLFVDGRFRSRATTTAKHTDICSINEAERI
jgi:hypothetical protein